MTLRPGPNVIRLLTSVICDKIVFVLVKPFQSSLIFASKAGGYRSEAPGRSFTLG